MTDTDDVYNILLDAIADQIWPNQRQLPKPVAHRSPAIRKIRSFAGVDEACGDALCGCRIELPNVDAYGLDVGQRLSRPDYARHKSGRGFSSGVPHFSSHAATSAVIDHAPCLDIAERPSLGGRLGCFLILEDSSFRLHAGLIAHFPHTENTLIGCA